MTRNFRDATPSVSLESFPSGGMIDAAIRTLMKTSLCGNWPWSGMETCPLQDVSKSVARGTNCFWCTTIKKVPPQLHVSAANSRNGLPHATTAVDAFSVTFGWGRPAAVSATKKSAVSSIMHIWGKIENHASGTNCRGVAALCALWPGHL